MQKEIERPLGGNRASVTRGPGGMPLRPLVAALVVAGVAGAAGVIAFGETPFRTIPEAVVSVPEINVEPVKEAPAKPVGGAKIVKLPRDTEPGTGGAVVVSDPAALGQDLRVAHLPDRDLIEDSEDGPLPVRAADGRRPLDVYARPWSGARGARIAIVIGGLGLSQTGTQAAIGRLPAEITLAFAPGGNSIGRWMQEARRTGHEIAMQIPLEPFDYPTIDPGRNTLTVDASAEDNLASLRWALSRTTNYTAVMNYMGARFASDAAAMQPVLEEIGRRGLMYFDDGSSARSTAPDVAAKGAVPFAAGDATIDGTRDRGAILKKLDELERTARAKGVAIGTGSAFSETVDAVSTWAAEARKRGIEIVPISAVAADPERG